MSKNRETTAYWSALAADYRSAHRSGLRAAFRRRELTATAALLALRPGESVLDAGCGAGVTTELLLGAGRRVVAVDLSPAMVARAAELPGVDARVADIETMRLGESFDKILCSGVFEFICDPGRALHTLVRHLSPGGRLVVSAPGPLVLGSAYELYHMWSGNRVYRRSMESLRRLVITAGLEILDTRAAGLQWHIAGAHRDNVWSAADQNMRKACTG